MAKNDCKPEIPEDNSHTGEEICQICLEATALQTLRGCKHEFCILCLQQFIAICINDGFGTVVCPAADCSEQIHPTNVRDLIRDQPELLRKLDYYTVRRALINDPEVRWCPGKGNICNFALLVPENDREKCPKLSCETPECRIDFCSKCGRPWHPDAECILDPIPDLLQKSSTHKACPSCLTIIEKSGGCNEMRCRNCGIRFCWICGRKRPGSFHFVGRGTCPFWSNEPSTIQLTRQRTILLMICCWILALPLGAFLLTLLAIAAAAIAPPTLAFKLFQQEKHRWLITRLILAFFAGLMCYIFVIPASFLLAALLLTALLFYVYFWLPLSLCIPLEFLDQLITIAGMEETEDLEEVGVTESNTAANAEKAPPDSVVYEIE